MTQFPDQIAIQSLLCPALTPVPANIDFARFKAILDDTSKLLNKSGLEGLAIELALENFPGTKQADRVRHARFAVESLRLEVLRHLLGMPSFRKFSTMVCGSDMLSDFCGLRRIDGIRSATKSTLDRRSKLFSESQLRRLQSRFTEVCGKADLSEMIGLDEAISMDTCLVDSTCLDADIHFPIDWVLLRDVSLTLLKAIKLIRRAGVLCRMPSNPEGLARQMNRLCIEMTHARRKKDAKKIRKRILREMKRLLHTIEGHAVRHREKLILCSEKTRFSQREAERICEQINGKTGQIKQVIKQAHERIIGGRVVSSKEKILSVHQEDIHVIVRGKAGKEVEFGNTLMISENLDGYITDWKLYREQAPSESKQLIESLKRQSELDVDKPVRAVCGDRGFDSKATTAELNKLGIFDAICPRDINVLRERMQDGEFHQLQKRRGGTEARIATLTNRWLGGRLRAKGHAHRAQAVGWAVLAHNLWFVARKLAQQREEELAKAA